MVPPCGQTTSGEIVRMSLTLHMHPLASYCWKTLIALYENATPFTPQLDDPAQRAALRKLWPSCQLRNPGKCLICHA